MMKKQFKILSLILITVSLLAVSFSCGKEKIKQDLTQEQPMSAANNKGGKKAAGTVIQTSLPTVLTVTASLSGSDIIFSHIPDTAHVIQILTCNDATFSTPTDTLIFNWYQNPNSTVYPSSVAVQSGVLTGHKFVRVQGDYYVGTGSMIDGNYSVNSGLFFSPAFEMDFQ